MNVIDIKKIFRKELSFLYSLEEIDFLFSFLSEVFLYRTRLDIALEPYYIVPINKQEKFKKALEELKYKKPIQYILKTSKFCNLDFFLNQSVLIPRPETQELVDWVLKEPITINSKIIDIGTGSGCIAISIAKNYPAHISAIDISIKALKVAKINSQRHNVKINWIQKDILTATTIKGPYDIVVSNPPYVRELEKKYMNKTVLDYEPHLALFVNNENPLIFYNKIGKLAFDSLYKNGLLFFEINQYLGGEIIEILKKIGFSHIELRKDFRGNDRMIRAVKR